MSGEELQFFGAAPLKYVPIAVPLPALGEEEHGKRVSLGTGGGNAESIVPLARTYSVRDLARRMFILGRLGSGTYTTFAKQPYTLFNGNGDSVCLDYLGSPFGGRRGGLRWYGYNTSTSTRLDYWDPRGGNVPILDTFLPTDAWAFHDLSGFSSNFLMRVESTFTTPYNYLLMPHAVGYADLDRTNEGTLYSVFLAGAQSNSLYLCAGGADDFRFGIWLGPSLMKDL